MPLVLITDEAFFAIPETVDFWFLGGPEMDMSSGADLLNGVMRPRYTERGWSSHDAHVFHRDGAWFLLSQSSRLVTANGESAHGTPILLKTGDVIEAKDACPITTHVLPVGADSDAQELFRTLKKRGLVEES